MPSALPHFASRQEAGEMLARHLTLFGARRSAVVVALDREGIETGYGLSSALRIPLYPYVVRKLGLPGNRTYGIGAIAEGGATSMDEEMMRIHNVDWDAMEPVIDEERAELRRRSEFYLTHARPSLEGKSVLLTDEGAVTGNTMLAAIADIRQQKPAEIIVALPLCPLQTLQRLRQRADDVIALATPAMTESGERYAAVSQPLTDEAVLRFLQHR